MATTSPSKLNTLYQSLPMGTPVTSRQLADLGVSADLAVSYVRSGWLQRLARGVFSRAGDTPLLGPSLLILQDQIPGLHVGGKTALAWHGIQHFVDARPKLTLYGWENRPLPEWFTRHFPSTFRRKRLFKETLRKPLHMTTVPRKAGPASVSATERAFLELLSEVGVRQSLEDVRLLARGLDTLRSDVLGDLLKKCTNVKTVRLCLTFGKEFSHPWYSKLNLKTLPRGSASTWVARSSTGTLVLKQ
ncbi:MAG TPA: type IV toxin-antitoxin system AbiEi family antitoxin domain-containing protein [Steroidobacteraceae bacterium]|nr:type IV toxin-antitoxin system AbiEi family antitoxin domain-containing protein [Steroidobacteraceae bacterium]